MRQAGTILGFVWGNLHGAACSLRFSFLHMIMILFKGFQSYLAFFPSIPASCFLGLSVSQKSESWAFFFIASKKARHCPQEDISILLVPWPGTL